MEKVVPAKKKGMGVSTSSAYSNYSKGSENSLPKWLSDFHSDADEKNTLRLLSIFKRF